MLSAHTDHAETTVVLHCNNADIALQYNVESREKLMVSRAIAGSIIGFFDTFGRARRTYATYSELSRLSDAALARRGLKRTDLPQAAYRSGFDTE